MKNKENKTKNSPNMKIVHRKDEVDSKQYQKKEEAILQEALTNELLEAQAKETNETQNANAVKEAKEDVQDNTITLSQEGVEHFLAIIDVILIDDVRGETLKRNFVATIYRENPQVKPSQQILKNQQL